MKSIYILTRDLRFKENKTLEKTCESQNLAFIYWLPEDFNEMKEKRKAFLLQSLEDFQKKLSEKNHTLYFMTQAEDLREEAFDKLFISKVYNSKDQKRLEDLKKTCEHKSADFYVLENTTLYSIKSLPFSIEDLPAGFSSFRRKIEKRPIAFNISTEEQDIPKGFSLNLPKIESLFDKTLKANEEFKGGEDEALKRLHSYLWEKERANTYKDTRNGMLDFDDSTKFSPWMALGCLSPITIMNELLEFERLIERNESTYWIYFEILWREYFKLYSLKNGDKIFSLHGLGQKTFKINDLKNKETEFRLWAQGQTKEPFVNANMIELSKTGWMSNRGRQNVASYLSKHMGLDWRLGAEHFQRHLIDYDVESNWGNWNYNAGVGTDPRDRVFNIKRQSEMYDPEKSYQKRWLS